METFAYFSDFEYTNKCKLLLWRAYYTASLSTLTNLCRRGLSLDPTCWICLQHPETMTHILWACPYARNVWAQVSGRIKKLGNTEHNDFLDIKKDFASNATKSEMESWTMVSWALWMPVITIFFRLLSFIHNIFTSLFCCMIFKLLC